MKNRRTFLTETAAFTTMGALACGTAPTQPGGAVQQPETESWPTPLLMPDDFSELHLTAWRVEPGTPDPKNPLIEGDMPWDAGGIGIHGSVFKDPRNGRWKAYLVATPPEETAVDWRSPWASNNHSKRRLCLFESEDGVHWSRPRLSNASFGQHEKTNIIFDLDRGRPPIPPYWSTTATPICPTRCTSCDGLPSKERRRPEPGITNTAPVTVIAGSCGANPSTTP